MTKPLCKVCRVAYSLKPCPQTSAECPHCQKIRSLRATMSFEEKRFEALPYIDLKHGESAWLPSL